MPFSDELRSAAKALAKEGKAFVTVTLVAYANDVDFGTDPPSCRVTVTARDPADGNRIISTETADISTNTKPYSQTFEIKVQTPIKSLRRFIFLSKHRSLSIDVRADPIGGFDQWYESDTSITGLTVQSGETVARNVSLKPRQEESRLDRGNLFKKGLSAKKPE